MMHISSHRVRFALFFATILFALSSAPPAQVKITGAAALPSLTYADLQRLCSVKDVELSPDGAHAAYTVACMDSRQDRSVDQLWVRATAGRNTPAVLIPHASTPAWSPDSTRLAVVIQGEPGKTTTVETLRASDRQKLNAFSVPPAPGNLVWSPDAASLAFTCFIPETPHPSFLESAVVSAGSALARPPDAQWASPVQVTQAANYRRDGGHWLTPGHTHLFVLSTATGNVQQVGSGPFDDTDPSWMPDSRTLLFTSDRRPEDEHASRKPAIYKTDLLGHATQLTHDLGSYSTPVGSPDGRWIAYTVTPYRAVNYTRTDLYVMRTDGDGTRRLAAGLDRDLASPHWSSDGQGLYARYADHGISHVDLFGLNGTQTARLSRVGDAFSVSQGGNIAYTSQSEDGPDELDLYRPGRSIQSLTSLNGFLHQRQLGRLLHVEARSGADGTAVEGWAVLPPGASGHAKLPAILAMHGGPFGNDGPFWSAKYQLLAAAGYAVLYANYRGSTSYGSSFSEPADHDFPGLAYDDIMSIADKAVRQGFADPDRLFLTGGSAGGELATWIIGKTRRFKAAVAEKPVTNLLTDALTTDQYLASPDFAGDAPWTRERELWAHSSLSLAGSMTTPTLFIVGEQDGRTPLDQTLQLYGALQLQGVPTALMHVPDAGHESLASRPSQYVAEIAAAVAWFRHFDPGDGASAP